MGKVLSTYVKRPFKNFNVESRAHKYIDKQIPKAAPRHPTTVHLIDKLVNENPDLINEIQKKDDKLLGNLKDVYVTATTIESIKVPETSKRTLPSRQQFPIVSKWNEDEGKETKTKSITEGRITLMEATELLIQFQELEADEANLKDAVTKYRLDEDLIHQIVKHFSTLQLHVPSGEASGKVPGLYPKFAKPEKQKTLE